MTMPARRRTRLTRSRVVSEIDPDSSLRPEQHSYSGDTNDNLSRLTASAVSPTGATTPDDFGFERTVVRVRNFSTKSGNLINRGDSIKYRSRGSTEMSEAGRGGKVQRGLPRQQHAHASVSRNSSLRSQCSSRNSMTNRNQLNGEHQSAESDLYLEECRPVSTDALGIGYSTFTYIHQLHHNH